METRSTTRSAPLALAADIACVVVFLRNRAPHHAEGLTLGGIAETAWPFLSGNAGRLVGLARVAGAE